MKSLIADYRKFMSSAENHIDYSLFDGFKDISHFNKIEQHIINAGISIFIEIEIIKSIKNISFLHKMPSIKYFTKHEKNMISKKKVIERIVSYFFNFNKEIPVDDILLLSTFIYFGTDNQEERKSIDADFTNIINYLNKIDFKGAVFKIYPIFFYDNIKIIKGSWFKDGTLYFIRLTDYSDINKDVRIAILAYLINKNYNKLDIVIQNISIIYPEFKKEVTFKPNEVVFGEKDLFEVFKISFNELKYRLERD